MSDTVELVQGDQNVDVDFTITDKNTGLAVNLTGATVKLYYRKIGDTALTATVNCTLPGGGSDGKVRAALTAACMVTAGRYEGELETTIGSKIQTVRKKAKFDVRAQIG